MTASPAPIAPFVKRETRSTQIPDKRLYNKISISALIKNEYIKIHKNTKKRDNFKLIFFVFISLMVHVIRYMYKINVVMYGIIFILLSKT